MMKLRKLDVTLSLTCARAEAAEVEKKSATPSSRMSRSSQIRLAALVSSDVG